MILPTPYPVSFPVRKVKGAWVRVVWRWHASWTLDYRTTERKNLCFVVSHTKNNIKIYPCFVVSSLFRVSCFSNTPSYLAIKLSNFKSVDEKLSELEPRKSLNIVLKIVSRKNAFKSFGVPSNSLPVKFSVSKSRSVYEISQFFLAIFKKAIPLIYPND